MEDMFRFADPPGPAKIAHIHLPNVSLKAIVVTDKIACGPEMAFAWRQTSAWRNALA